AWSVIAAVALMGLAWTAQGRFARHNPKFIPVEALNRVLEIHRECPRARVFHAYNWGGYLTWHGWPSFLNCIDDRNEVQGQGWIEEWDRVVSAKPGWEQFLSDGQFEVVAVQVDSPLSEALTAKIGHRDEAPGSSDWQEVYRDKYAVIFRRNLPLPSRS